VDLVLQCLMSFSLLVLWGSLLALAASMLSSLLEVFEPAPPVSGVRPGTRERLSPQPPPPAPPRNSIPARETATGEDPALAAAIGLALALYLQEKQPSDRAVPGPGPSSVNTWALSGRWQAMQARREIRKR
jgi:hypothetical protein